MAPGCISAIAPPGRNSPARKPDRMRDVGVMEIGHVTRWIGGVLVIAVIFESGASTSLVAEPGAGKKLQTAPTEVFASRHYHRRSHYTYRPYYPYYYGRPYYYSPGPFFVPVPSFWGYGWQWW
jgi:hypothetical protein